MERDFEDAPGYRRLPRPDAPHPDDTAVAWQAGTTRDSGVRRARRVSNWTAAALIAGVAATTGYFAHASQAAAPAAGGTTGMAATNPAAHHRACPASPVATSGGSGVTAAVPASGSCTGGGRASGSVAPAWTGGDD